MKTLCDQQGSSGGAVSADKKFDFCTFLKAGPLAGEYYDGSEPADATSYAATLLLDLRLKRLHSNLQQQEH
jgi:hypothetical protein